MTNTPKYFVEVNFLTGGWNEYWDQGGGWATLEEAMPLANHLKEIYLEARVIKKEIVWYGQCLIA